MVNAVAPAAFPNTVPSDLDRVLADIPGDADLGSLPSPAVLAACASQLRARHELNLRYLAEIERRCALPIVPLPYVPGGPQGVEPLHRFSEALTPERRAPARPAGVSR